MTLVRDDRHQVPLTVPRATRRSCTSRSSTTRRAGGLRRPSRTFIPELKKRWPDVTAIELSDQTPPDRARSRPRDRAALRRGGRLGVRARGVGQRTDGSAGRAGAAPRGSRADDRAHRARRTSRASSAIRIRRPSCPTCRRCSSPTICTICPSASAVRALAGEARDRRTPADRAVGSACRSASGSIARRSPRAAARPLP